MNFCKKDFTKSGITEETIKTYTENGYLKEDSESWTLYYPELFYDEKTEYYNKRLKNYTDSKYIKPKNKTSRLFRPLGLSVDTLKNDYLIITEGEKKAIKAVQEGFNCIALAGVWGWKKKIDEEEQNKEALQNNEDIIPDIVDLNLKNKNIYLCYDNDMWQKEEVCKALYHFALYLKYEKKAIVKIVKLPKDNNKLGLDDYLIKYGNIEFQKLLESSKEICVKEIREILQGATDSNVNFPINIFEKYTQDIIIQISKNLDAPIDYIASAFLGGASTIMNGRFSLQIDQHWQEHPILWIALIGSPSQRKSPCFNTIKKLLDKYDLELTNHFNKQIYQYENDLDNYKRQLKTKTTETINKPLKPLKQRLTTQNVTVEALSKASWANNQDTCRGVSIWSDELAFLLKGLGQYKRGGNDEEYFLQAWSWQLTNILRQDLDYTTYIGHTIVGTIQPQVLKETLFAKGIDTFNGLQERWLYVCCNREETGNKENNTVKMNILENTYDCLFNVDKEGKIYKFSPEAKKLFDDFCSKIVQLKKNTQYSDLYKSYLQKQTNYVARFSLILHCLKNQSNLTIPIDIVEKAITLSNYFVKCFEQVLIQRLSAPPLTQETINYMKTKKINKISPSALYKSNTSKYKSTNNTEIVLENLASLGWGRMQKAKNGGKSFVIYL